MNLPLNLFDENVHVQTLLCQPDKKIIGEILPHDFNATFKFNTYSEISFTIDKYYNDLFDGVTKVNPYYELIESLRIIYLRGVGHFVIQDVEENEGDIYTKTISCFSLEYTTGQKYLESFYVNTGEEGSIETMYHSQQYGAEYSIDNYYTEVNVNVNDFDAYERYYIREYNDASSYNYVEQQVLNADDFDTYQGQNSETTLYIKKYPNVRFYWPTKPELSLLHNVFDRIPEWKIGHVDRELWHQERTFSEDRTAVYDFLYNTAADTLDFVMVWDSINGVCNFYKTTEDGVTADNEVETQWNTDVFISKENLADAIDIKYSTDDIKTKLKITGSDSLDVRDVNLGQNYILDLSYYIPPKNIPSKWVGYYLQDKYNRYIDELAIWTEQYQVLVSARAAVYNEYSDLMNYVPVDPRVMLIGDEFDKLHCVYTKYRRTTEYVANKTYYTYEKGKYTEVDPAPSQEDVQNDKNYYYIENTDAQVTNLQTKLDLYRVDQEDDKTRSAIAKTDDVLLTLENNNSDSVTIRVRYDAEDTNDKPGATAYRIYRTLTMASTGVSNTTEFTLYDWVAGNLTAEKLGLTEETLAQPFKIKSIGTLGAYFCLARDETNQAELEDYGIRLLEEKKDTYTKIFITQTEGYMNKEGAQCITSNELPQGNEYPDGTKWLDTNTMGSDGKLIMKIRTDGSWVDYIPDENNYENYARFYENYTKLSNVQAVLAEKQLIANYLLNGVPVKAMYISNENINSNTLLAAAAMHFIILNNNFVASLQQPTEDLTEGMVWFQSDSVSLSVPIYKYINGAWVAYESQSQLILTEYNKEFGFITFTTTSDQNKKYAAYVTNGIPYVSYAHSQGLCLAQMNVIKEKADMNNPNNFSKEDLISLSPFIREDEFSDNNFLLTSYESEEEEMNIKQELLKAGDKELKKICQPKLSFSATMANILAIPEFAPIKNQFKLGNFIRIGIREGYVKRARLLEVQINLDDPSDFSATFGDLISTRSEIDKHAELLQQAVTAGKSVAANQSKWQRGADKATALDQAINDGLKDATLSVASSAGQNISWDSRGILCRKMNETTGEYYDEQMLITNNRLVATSDNWKTSSGVFGKYSVNGQDHWGVLANAVVAGYINGSVIEGGRLEIGGNQPGDKKFIVNEDGSVEIGTVQKNTDGTQSIKSEYATADALESIKDAYQYRVELSYTGNTIFNTTGQKCTVTCRVYDENGEVSLPNTTVFKWYLNGVLLQNKTTSTIEITADDITGSAQLNCQVTFNK